MNLFGFNLRINMKGTNLPVKDSWLQGGKADPYVVLRKGHGLVGGGEQVSCFGTKTRKSPSRQTFIAPKPGEYMGEENSEFWVYDGKANHQKNTLEPDWPEIVVPLDRLCDDSDLTKPIVIDIWDYDFECPHDDFMGFVQM